MKLHIFETLEVDSAHLHIKSGDEFNFTDLLAGDIISISSTNSLLKKQGDSEIIAISVERPNSQLMFVGGYKNGTFIAPCVAIRTTSSQWWDYYTVKGILADVFPMYDIDFSIKNKLTDELGTTRLRINIEKVTTKKI